MLSLFFSQVSPSADGRRRKQGRKCEESLQNDQRGRITRSETGVIAGKSVFCMFKYFGVCWNARISV